jgi:hypothetical protein
MSFNKKDNKLDFRNVKNSQFDPGQTQKMAFSELQSAFRQYNTNAILKDAYTHFIQELDANDRPTKVTYYQATAPASDRINVRADSGGDLAGTYFTLQEFITKKTHVFWFNVSGSGTAPGIGDVEHEITLSNNDPASVVAFAVKNAIEATEEFYVTNNDLLSAYVDIQYYQFGETQAINVGTTGFISNRLVQGASFEVGQVELSYDVDGNPIYNGNKLSGLLYNPYTASFDVERDEIVVTSVVDLAPLISKDPEVFNVNMPVAGTEYSLTLPVDVKRFSMKIRDNAAKYEVSWVSGGATYSVSRGTEYTEEGLKLEAGTNTIYFKSSKNNMVMEFITWK